MASELDKSVQYLKSIGQKRAESFSKIGITTVKDLLFYFPSKYLDRSTILNSIKVYDYVLEGYSGEVTIIGEVYDKEVKRFGKKTILTIIFKDNTGYFEATWFQAVSYFKDMFKEGDSFAISGKPQVNKFHKLQFIHPDFDRLGKSESDDFLNTGKIIPFYRIPGELRKTSFGDFSIRKLIHSVVENYADLITESLPDFIICDQKLLSLKETVKNSHFPESNEILEETRRRLKFEELFYFECLVALRKKLHDSIKKETTAKLDTNYANEFVMKLPFKLTNDQKKSLNEIKEDLESPKTMNRLLQGDVGSGKTIVSLISILLMCKSGYQCALMAPTEILADQHYRVISKLLDGLGLKIDLLLGGQLSKKRKAILESITSGETNIVIGTHALIEANVEFQNLGLIVIDEQHRFGVMQRGTLIKKGTIPNVLIMTATPIPRTLTMTIYGDLDVSIIKEMPQNRKPIKTALRGESKLPEIYKFLIQKKEEGYQSFIVYPLVEESEKLSLKAAETYYVSLQEEYLSGLSIGLVHGRMNWKEKESVMFDFLNKKFDVLVSTTVIEVGIDIPDANIIIINDAHRFGLSQLHQLRGRVGRSFQQGYCILVTEDSLANSGFASNFDLNYLSEREIEKYKTFIRLHSMVQHTSGFKLSEIDLRLRGPGDIFSTQQSGLPNLIYTDVTTDLELIEAAKNHAFKIISNDSSLRKKENSLIKNTLKKNYAQHLVISNIA
ncbi:MAG: ATP-dependent DNA helicase RecG [Melioribacteraceae bacterium]